MAEPAPAALVASPGEILAGNVRRARRGRDLSQEAVAERMALHGHGWVRATVSAVERGERRVTVAELLSLALVVGVVVPDLLDPMLFAEPGQAAALDLGVEILRPEVASAWLHGQLRLRLWRERGQRGWVLWREPGEEPGDG